MAGINTFLNSAGNDFLRLLLIFVLVLIVVFIIFFLVRAVLGFMRKGVLGGKRSRQPRLGFIEEAEIDARRRLVLIRRDNIEHLILLGGTNDLVIESNIIKAFDQQKVAAPLSRETQITREIPHVQSEDETKAFAPAAKSAARKAAGESTRSAPPVLSAPVARKIPEVDLRLDDLIESQDIKTPPNAPVQQGTFSPQTRPARTEPAMQAPSRSDQSSHFERPAPISAQGRFTPIPVAPQSAPSQAAKPLVRPPEEPVVIIPSQSNNPNISFDSLEDEMAALLGQKPTH